MANETIGSINCPIGNHEGEVRKQKNGLYYWLCPCGKITPNYRGGQAFVKNNAKFFDGGEPVNGFEPVNGKPPNLQPATIEEIKPDSQAVNDDKPEPQKAAPRSGASLLDDLLGW